MTYVCDFIRNIITNKNKADGDCTLNQLRYDTNPIILDEKQRRKFLGSTEAETWMPSVALSPFMNILNALLQWNQRHLG